MAKRDNQITSYRTFFTSDAGKRVLAELLADSGYFDIDISTPEEIAVQNFMKKILKNMGIYGVESVDSYVQKLSELPIEKG